MSNKVKNVLLSYLPIVLILAWVNGSHGQPKDKQETAQLDLPGYYEFFMKAGKSSQLKSEAARDEKIKTGELKPIYSSDPVVDVQLPDGFTGLHGTRDYVGRKNLVLIAGRAWW